MWVFFYVVKYEGLLQKTTRLIQYVTPPVRQRTYWEIESLFGANLVIFPASSTKCNTNAIQSQQHNNRLGDRVWCKGKSACSCDETVAGGRLLLLACCCFIISFGWPGLEGKWVMGYTLVNSPTYTKGHYTHTLTSSRLHSKGWWTLWYP